MIATSISVSNVHTVLLAVTYLKLHMEMANASAAIDTLLIPITLDVIHVQVKFVISVS